MENEKDDKQLIIDLLIAMTGFEYSYFDAEELNDLSVEELVLLETKFINQ